MSNNIVRAFVIGGILSFALSGLAARESVVFVEAHPDDLAGHLGTALRLSEKFDVHVIDFTHGEMGLGWDKMTNGYTKAVRTDEETHICNLAGFFLHWCDAIDGFSYADSNVCNQISAYLCEIKPRAVFCHWPVDCHCDHVMSAAATLKAIQLSARDCEVYFHEQDGQSRGFKIAYYVDITPVVDRKAELAKLYVSQEGDAIARRKAESTHVYARNIGVADMTNAEIIGVLPGTVRPGKSIFDVLDGVTQ